MSFYGPENEKSHNLGIYGQIFREKKALSQKKVF